MQTEDIKPKIDITMIVFFKGNLSRIIPRGKSEKNTATEVAT